MVVVMALHSLAQKASMIGWRVTCGIMYHATFIEFHCSNICLPEQNEKKCTELSHDAYY